MPPKTLKNPIALAHPAPVDLDAAIEEIRLALAGISWLEKAFHRAYEMPQPDPERQATSTISVPMVYQGGGEYYPVMANDALKSYSFFRARGAKDFDDYASGSRQLNGSTPLDIIVWANLRKIDATKDYIFTSELERDVVSVLNTSPNLQLLRVWDEDAEDIFPGYTVYGTKRDLLMCPYQAFRIEATLQYDIQCLDL